MVIKMRIEIRSKNGSFEIGGGNHPVGRLLEIDGLGFPSSTVQQSTFAGMPGYVASDRTDNARTITMSVDLSMDASGIEKIYKVLQEECEIIFFLKRKWRKIKGICLNPSDAEKIILGNLYKLVMQFECPHPYFTDFSPVKISLSTRIDQFPTTIEDGQGYITLPAVATKRYSSKAVTNNGDTVIYPTITVTAKEDLESIKICNLTTGKHLTLQYEIAADEKIIIDIKNREITSDIHGSVLNKITDDTILSDFYLDCGDNELTVADIETGVVEAIISYENQYKAVMIC